MNIYDENKMFLIDQISIEVHVVMIDQLNDMVEFQAFVQQVLVILKQKNKY
jgi:hypothetical protein